MKPISRKKAIQLINIIAIKQYGMNKEELHQSLSAWGFGEEPHLSQMTALKLHEILKNLRRFYYVQEPKYVLFLRCEAKRCGVSLDFMDNMIKKKFKANSIYQLKTPHVQGLTKALNYYRKP